MIKVSVTTLEEFRRYQEDPDYDAGAFIHRLQHGIIKTPAMEAGEVFHEILEHAEYDDEFEVVQYRGHTFDFSDVRREFAIPAVRELSMKRVLFGEMMVSGRIDSGIPPAFIIDYKLTERFDEERYADSFQWRYYLMMFNTREFRYIGFERKQIEENSHKIKAVKELSLYRYDGMESQCIQLARDFKEFITGNQLVDLFTLGSRLPVINPK